MIERVNDSMRVEGSICVGTEDDDAPSAALASSPSGIGCVGKSPAARITASVSGAFCGPEKSGRISMSVDC